MPWPGKFWCEPVRFWQEAGVEDELVNMLCNLSAQHYLPILAHHKVTTETLRHMRSSDLKKVCVQHHWPLTINQVNYITKEISQIIISQEIFVAFWEKTVLLWVSFLFYCFLKVYCQILSHQSFFFSGLNSQNKFSFLHVKILKFIFPFFNL